MKQRALVDIEWRGIKGGELKSAGELKVAQVCGRAIKKALRERFASSYKQVQLQVILWTDGKSLRVHEAWRNSEPALDRVRQSLQQLEILKTSGLVVI